MIIQPFASMLFPYTAASNEADAVRRTNMLCRNASVVMLFLMALMVLLVKPWILLLFGEEFLPAVTFFYVLTPAIYCFLVNQFLYVHVAARGNPKVMFWINIAGFLVGTVIIKFLGYLWKRWRARK
jgi:O-antigen/teichoic acid export membrane protein